MRKRSSTLYAETIEEYTRKAVEISNQSYNPLQISSNSSLKKNINASSLLPLLINEEESPRKKQPSYTKESSQYWPEFDFGCDGRQNEQLFNGALAKGNDSMEAEEPPEVIRKPITKKIMVIGSSGSGRHSLINLMFDNKENQVSLRQTMDLMTKKTRKEEEFNVKYHFWMRSLNDTRFEGLVKVYYKSASIFLFGYSIVDRESFENLSRAIEEVKTEVPREKFVGILIGNKCDQS